MNLNDQQLVAEAFEGTLDESGFRKLQQRLREDPEMVALYRDHALLHHSLAEEFEGRRMIGEEAPAAAGTSLGGLIGLAVILLAVVGLVFWRPGKSGETQDAEGAPDEVVAPVIQNSGEKGRVLLEDRFGEGAELANRRPVQGESHWRLERGAPAFRDGYLDGDNYEAYFYLPAGSMSADFPLLLVTVSTAHPAGAPFHSPGWAGVSLYQDGYEVCFFGDSFGVSEVWSLDVKRRLPPILSSPPLTGIRTMTLRYDRRDGVVEMFEGPEADGEPVARSKLLPGLNFDQVRIGASEGAGFALSSLLVRVTRAE